MANDLEPITGHSEICKVLPVAYEKCFVDLFDKTYVNQIDVVRAHNDTKRERQGFFARFYDGITGKGARRDVEINSRLIDLVEGAFDSIEGLVERQALSCRAIAKIRERFVSLTDNVDVLARLSEETHHRLADLTNSVQMRFEENRKWVERTDAYLDAKLQLDHVFEKWGAGDYHGFSLAGRCYAALENLRWGKFGEYCRRYHREDRCRVLVEILKDRAAVQMREDASLPSGEERILTEKWTRPISGEPLAGAQDALAYLGSDHYGCPFVAEVSQAWDGDVYLKRDPLRDRVPLMSSAERMADGLVRELFGG